jgi:dihydrofolate synthase/folylpolyglutamate synthase
MSHQDLISQVNSIRPAVAAVPEITTFEITTAIGFQYFAEQKVDIAIVEVGLGGRLDATNVVTPIISVITSLSYDHMNILGDTIVKIAIEKAGIIKKNIPVVIAPQGFPEVNEVLAEIAEKNHSQVTFVNEEYVYSSKSHSLEGQLFSLTKINSDELKPAEYTISLLGYHQVENAVTARAVIDVIRTKEFQISEDDVVDGFKSASWPCRFEIIEKRPLIIVDSAHNVDSAVKLQATIKDYLKNENVTLIFGASEDKDIRGMFEVLFSVVDDIIVTKSIHPRAFEPEDLAGIASQLQREAKITSSIEEALELIGGKSASDVVLITGSIFVAAGAKEILTQGKSQEKI